MYKRIAKDNDGEIVYIEKITDNDIVLVHDNNHIRTVYEYDDENRVVSKNVFMSKSNKPIDIVTHKYEKINDNIYKESINETTELGFFYREKYHLFISEETEIITTAIYDNNIENGKVRDIRSEFNRYDNGNLVHHHEDNNTYHNTYDNDGRLVRRIETPYIIEKSYKYNDEGFKIEENTKYTEEDGCEENLYFEYEEIEEGE